MARKRKRYTDDERATYVAMLVAEGYPDRLGALKKVSDFVGCHPNVLRRWWKGTQNPPPTQLVSEKKGAIEERLEGVVHLILDLLPDALEEADARDLTITLGIAIDKRELLRGKPTERSEIIGGLTDDERIARIADLLDTARARRVGSPANGDSNLVVH